MQVWPGHPYPLGATYDGTGTNFAAFSEVADVDLCLFDGCVYVWPGEGTRVVEGVLAETAGPCSVGADLLVLA